jgi:hypothetical protein
MATWTAPKTWANAAVTAAEFNTHIRDNETWLKGAFTQLNVTSDAAKAKITPALVGARVYKAADQTITNNTQTALNFDSERFDSDTFHDTVTNNTRLTIPASMGGNYIIGGGINFAANATGQRVLYIYVNGTGAGFPIVADTNIPGAATAVYMNVSTLFHFSAADYAELIVYQTSGGNLSVTAVSAASPEFYIHRHSSD